MALFEKLDKYKDFALLMLRVGAGILLMTHGLPKLVGGPANWRALGGTMALLGIKFLPTFWGFMAAVAEGVGGLLMVLGLFFRPAALLAFFTMAIAVYSHLSKSGGVTEMEKALLYGVIFFALLFLGPGKFSVDKK